MEKYNTCTHSIFDEVWGDYKCEIDGLFKYNPRSCENCEMYKKRKKGEEQKVSKNEYDSNKR